ncbi:hypothetical protein [Foetidibacter luteolus]|uniref:hypothetical protein n=1 Tax=Foetidibacter luteolus TaxID=2608880 RepID=UPI00129A0C74|nr:hypothetical protein [Foetidibacter luteolus]
MITKNIFRLLAAVAFGGIIFIACSKDDDPTPIPQIQRLTQKDWKITNITVPKTGTPAGDSTLFEECMEDDLVKFSTTAGFDFQDGTDKCDSSIFYYAKGIWGYDLSRDSIQLGTSNPTPSKYISWKVLTLNDSVLKVTYIDSLDPAKKLTKTISFKN